MASGLRKFAVALLLAGSASAHAADAIGVEEHLGAQLPLDQATFVDEEGRPVPLASLFDKPVVLSLVFFRCHGLCTPLLNDLAQAADGSGLAPGRDFRLVSISFDPRDTPELARAKQANQLARMKRTQPTAADWRFLTGDPANIERITRAVGFNYLAAREGDGFNHPGVVVFLSKDGTIRRYLHGSTFNPLDVRMSVEDAAAGVTRPFIRKLAQLCFAYDPAGRTYVLAVNRVILFVTLLFALAFGAYLLVRGRAVAARAAAASGVLSSGGNS